MKSDYDILKKYSNGRIVDPDDDYALKRLSSVNMIRTGTHVEIIDAEEKIIIKPTARTTRLGMSVYESMKPTFFEKICAKLNGDK